MELTRQKITGIIRSGLAAPLFFIVFLILSTGALAAEPAADKVPAPETAAVSNPLQDLIETALAAGTSVEALFAELIATGEPEADCICALLQAGVEPHRVIVVALNNNVDSAVVHESSLACGASQTDVQVGYSMAGENFVFQVTDQLDQTADEYLYDPPSQSR